MSPASTIHSLLERLLPATIMPVEARFGRRQRLFTGVGLPVGGVRCALVLRFDAGDDPHVLYRDLRRAAVHGDVAALTDLGWTWLNGKYWRADPLLANHLLRMAALQGCATAWFNLGQQHYFGKGVDIAYAKAAEYYRHAFECGMTHAAAALGDLYEEEVCDGDQAWAVDPPAAYQWFLRGAQQGDARCRFEVGYRLLHGVQVAVDTRAGLYWLELASTAGVVQAAEELALHFSRRNAARYRHWRAQAIELGSRRAGGMGVDDRIGG
ncbi:tetratricopeptide repeat protein [Pseudomonas sp. RP23018S]|uniref:tetratricopeptide repeat protein n=1 Tax=Pseudomonas sp. RP23018S TaxID=3096037 RepID=UPI002ACA854E|nr:tetratricopeptide repeat protein [Pseudomonas sp. RP23018S]MDZ5603026.1 tetratricopeptide repeat protein [Pseudomonas sp. RP23018S]